MFISSIICWNNKKVNSMSKYSTILSTTIFLFFVALSQCLTRHYFQNSPNSCFFDLDYVSGSDSQFVFKDCGYTTCKDWINDGSLSYCNNWVTTYLYDYGSCTQTCCDSSAPYQTDKQSLQQCQDYLNYKGYLSIIYKLTIPIGLLLIAGIMFLCWRYRKSVNKYAGKITKSCRSLFDVPCKNADKQPSNDLKTTLISPDANEYIYWNESTIYSNRFQKINPLQINGYQKKKNTHSSAAIMKQDMSEENRKDVE